MFLLVSVVPIRAESIADFTVENLIVNQEGSILEFEFDALGYTSISSIELSYSLMESIDNYSLLLFGQCELVDDKYKGKIDLNEFNAYIYFPYGTYKLNELEVKDNNGDFSGRQIADLPDSKITLDEEDNVYKTLKQENFNVSVNSEDGCLYFRKNTGYTTYEPNVTYVDEYDNEIYLNVMNTTYDTSKLNLNVLGEYEADIIFNIQTAFNQYEDFVFTVPAYVVEEVGEILETTINLEISCTKEEFDRYMMGGSGSIVTFKVPVKINDGTVITEEFKVNLSGGAIDQSTDENGVTITKLGVFLPYNPKYKSASENVTPGRPGVGRVAGGMGSMPSALPGKIKVIKNFHVIDENGDVYDAKGNLVYAYEDREMISYDSQNEDEVNLSALYGTLPSYTVVEAEKVDTLDLEEYVAYDIKLVAAYGKDNVLYDNLEVEYDYIQPVGTTDLTIDLPEELADGESYVAYHYDDEGNKEEVEVTVENGKAYIKAESFSTYAIVKKSTTTPGGNEGNAGGNAGNGESAPGSGDNTNNNSGSNNNTTGSGTNNSSTNSNTTTSPNTGDSTNVAMLLALLLSSAYVLRRKRA